MMATEGKISPVGMDEESRVIAFLNVNFVRDEPLNHSRGITRGFKPPFDLLASGLCLKMESGSGDLMGLVMNAVDDLPHEKVKTQNEIEAPESPSSHGPEFQPVLEFLNYVEELIPVKDKEGLMHVQILAVGPRWRKTGVGRRLVEASVQLARDKGIQGLLVTCTSHYTSRMMDKIPGFRKVLSVPYHSYLDSSGKPVFSPPQPHIATDVYHMSL